MGFAIVKFSETLVTPKTTTRFARVFGKFSATKIAPKFSHG